MSIEQARRETREMLIKTLVETLYYVGQGKVARREFADKCECTEAHAEYELAVIVNDLVDRVKRVLASESIESH
jgi:hypothetical protein